jgi:predicted dehydrogenase
MGKRGSHHAKAFHDNPRFQLVGICDIDRSRLDDAAPKLGSPETATDASALCLKLKPDVFCFCTLPKLRLEMVRLGVECGAKLIAYEKPMAMSTNEALEIMRLVRKAGVKTVVSHQHRYGEHYQRVKEIIAGGALGRVHTVYGTATGWMMHMATHLVDYMRWFNDEADAEWVLAQAAGRGKLADVHASPDYVAGFIHFANGVHGIVEVGAGAPDVPEVDYWWRKNRIGALGTQGFAEVLTGGGWRAVTTNSRGLLSGPGSMDYEHDMKPYVEQMADWLDDPQKVHPCNGESAYKGFEIVMAMCRSVVEGGQIGLPLEPGYDELEALKQRLPEKKVLFSMPENVKEYG